MSATLQPDPLHLAALGASESAPRAAARDAVAEPRRALALDALRGFFLLAMTFGFSIAESVYPAWMYHRQEPPPIHAYAEIAGLTWRDLTYPAFLFTLAAAIPITFGLRVARGASGLAVARAALRRFALLFVFALVLAHSSGYWIGDYSRLSQTLGLTGFALLALLFTRRPASIPPRAFVALRGAGWALAGAYLAWSPSLYGKHFELARRDEILAELAFGSAATILIWYATRRDLALRAGLLALAVALSISAHSEGWVASFWWSSPLPELVDFSGLKLLCVLIPGSFAGECLFAWMRASGGDAAPIWSAARVAAIAVLCACASPVLVIGLYQRESFATAAAIAALGGGLCALVRAPQSGVERLLRDLVRWGALWLALGLVLEPSEGGIKKVPGTLSYWFALAGNSAWLLACGVALIDGLGLRRRLQWLVEVGQNPLVAYVILTLALDPLLDFIPGMGGFLRHSPAELLVRSALSVALVAGFVRELTRRRMLWRA